MVSDLRSNLRFFSQIVILSRVWFFFGCNFDFFVLGCSWFEILDRDYLLILPLLQNRICFVCGLFGSWIILVIFLLHCLWIVDTILFVEYLVCLLLLDYYYNHNNYYNKNYYYNNLSISEVESCCILT